jgi:hypothetical protein
LPPTTTGVRGRSGPTTSSAGRWSKSRQQRSQHGKYTLTEEGDKTRVRFELTVEPTVPLPGFVLKRAIKGSINDGTDGLRSRVLSAKKGGR